MYSDDSTRFEVTKAYLRGKNSQVPMINSLLKENFDLSNKAIRLLTANKKLVEHLERATWTIWILGGICLGLLTALLFR